MNRNLLKWLLQGFGFGLGLLVLVAALSLTRAGLAQGITGPNLNSSSAQGSDAPLPPEALSDKPQSVLSLPVALTTPIANPQAQADGADPAASVLSPYQEPKTGAVTTNSTNSALVVPVADFRSDGYMPEGYAFNFSTSRLAGRDVSGTCLMAPVYLPNGATVYQFWISAIDNDAANNLVVTLRRVSNYDGTNADIMASAVTTGASASIQSIGVYSIANPMVVYPDYSYYLTTCLPTSTLNLLSVRLWYSQ